MGACLSHTNNCTGARALRALLEVMASRRPQELTAAPHVGHHLAQHLWRCAQDGSTKPLDELTATLGEPTTELVFLRPQACVHLAPEREVQRVEIWRPLRQLEHIDVQLLLRILGHVALVASRIVVLQHEEAVLARVSLAQGWPQNTFVHVGSGVLVPCPVDDMAGEDSTRRDGHGDLDALPEVLLQMLRGLNMSAIQTLTRLAEGSTRPQHASIRAGILRQVCLEELVVHIGMHCFLPERHGLADELIREGRTVVDIGGRQQGLLAHSMKANAAAMQRLQNDPIAALQFQCLSHHARSDLPLSAGLLDHTLCGALYPGLVHFRQKTRAPCSAWWLARTQPFDPASHSGQVTLEQSRNFCCRHVIAHPLTNELILMSPIHACSVQYAPASEQQTIRGKTKAIVHSAWTEG